MVADGMLGGGGAGRRGLNLDIMPQVGNTQVGDEKKVERLLSHTVRRNLSALTHAPCRGNPKTSAGWGVS